METPARTVVVVVFSCFLTFVPMTAVMGREPDVTVVKRTCGGPENDPVSAAQQARQRAIEDAVQKTPQADDFNYKGKGSYDFATAFSRGHCQKDKYDGISKEGCHSCLQVCKRVIIQFCAWNIQGGVKLKDCQLEFQQIPFL